jgi:hypothetical protein
MLRLYSTTGGRDWFRLVRRLAIALTLSGAGMAVDQHLHVMQVLSSLHKVI